MKVKPQKFHCPSFTCFCKPSPHVYAPESLKLENTPHVPSTVTLVSEESPDQLSAEVKNDESNEKPKQSKIDCGDSIRSSLKKKGSVERAEEIKNINHKIKKVQWVDYLGMELDEIREFDSCEDDESDYPGETSNLCIIL